MEREITKNYRGIIDSTLREGRQYRWGEFTLYQQREIVEQLRDIGVERVEVGNPAEPKIAAEIASLLTVENRPPFLAHVRNNLEDVKAAIDIGVEGINLLTMVDEARLQGMSKPQTLEKHISIMKEGIALAQEKGLETRVSVEHFFTSNYDDAMRVLKEADDLGVNRIGLADTNGAKDPEEIATIVAAVREEIKSELEVHFHHDKGHSVSNAVMALKAGANWVDTTLLGIGERNGITALSLFLVNLYCDYPALTDSYRLELLTPAENLVMKFIDEQKRKTGVELGGVPFNLPTNQQNGFCHKAGMHHSAMVRHGTDQYQLFPAEVIGNSTVFVLGTPISGRTTKADIQRLKENNNGNR